MNATGRRDPNDDDEDRGFIEPADLKDENGKVDSRKIKSQNSNNPSAFTCTAKQCSDIRREMAKTGARPEEVAEKVTDFDGNHPAPCTVRAHARGEYSCPSPEPIVEYDPQHDAWIQRGDDPPEDGDSDDSDDDSPGAHVLLNVPRDLARDLIDDMKYLRDSPETDVPYDKFVDQMEDQL